MDADLPVVVAFAAAFDRRDEGALVALLAGDVTAEVLVHDGDA